MQDEHTTEAQAAAAALIAQFGEPKSPDTLRGMLALAYAVGAKTAATEAAEAVRKTAGA
jgi:hypothetical protein